MTVDRPTRLDELRAASEPDEALDALDALEPDGSTAAPEPPATVVATEPSTAGAGREPAGGRSTDDGDGRGSRTIVLVGAALVVVAVVAAVVIVLAGGSSNDPAPTAASSSTEPRVVAAPEAVAEENRHDDTCAAVQMYSVSDMLALGEHIANDPDAVLAAYEQLAVNAPDEMHPLIDQMGPLTRKAVAAVKSGELTTAAQVQAWLATAPAAELEAWVGPQQELAPQLAAYCA